MITKRVFGIALSVATASALLFSTMSASAETYVDKYGNPMLPIGGTIGTPPAQPDPIPVGGTTCVHPAKPDPIPENQNSSGTVEFDANGKMTVYAGSDNAFSIIVNGKKIGSTAHYKGETMMIPVNSVASRAGWDYDNDGGDITLKNGKDKIEMEVGSRTVKINGKTYTMPKAATASNGRVYAPWQFFEKALGLNVTIHKNGSVTVKGYKSSSDDDSTSYYSLRVNGDRTSDAPYKVDGVMMIPLREAVIELGYTYQNDSANKRAIFTSKDGVNCYIEWNQNKYPIDNEYKTLERATELRDGSLYVPMSFFEKALGCKAGVSGHRVTLDR